MKIYIILIILVFTSIAKAQIIINKDTSKSQFIINSANQFEISSNNNNQTVWNIGKAVSTTSSAQIELAATNKAFLINRVKLTSVQDRVTIPDPKEGMMTYNTNTAGTYPDNVVPGLFYMSENIWWRISDIDPQTSQEVRLLDLQSNTTSNAVAASSAQAQWSNAKILPIGSISIDKAGTYTFSIRLYGTSSNTTSTYIRGVGYLYLVKNNSSLIDFQEVIIPFAPSQAVITYTIVLMSPILSAGDQITLRLATPSGSPTITLISHLGLRADKTSLIYWKN